MITKIGYLLLEKVAAPTIGKISIIGAATKPNNIITKGTGALNPKPELGLRNKQLNFVEGENNLPLHNANGDLTHASKKNKYKPGKKYSEKEVADYNKQNDISTDPVVIPENQPKANPEAEKSKEDSFNWTRLGKWLPWLGMAAVSLNSAQRD